MWSVIEVLNGGGGGIFGPFDSYKAAVQFMLDPEMPDAEQNISTVVVVKDKI